MPSKNYSYIDYFGRSFSDRKNELGNHHFFAALLTDSFIERMFIDQLFECLRERDVERNILTGTEFTLEFIEERLETLGLFGQNTAFIVYLAESIPLENQKIFLEKLGELAQAPQVFFLFSKENKFFTQLGKKEDFFTIELSDHKFYEGAKALKFLADYKAIKLSPNVEKYILEHSEHSVSELSINLDLIKNFFGSTEVKIDGLNELIQRTRTDFFTWINYFCEKKFTQLHSVLYEWRDDFEIMRSFFVFAQGHIYKMLTVSEWKDKKALNQYDRNLIGQASKWNERDLRKALEFFSEMEIESKKRNEFLIHLLKLKLDPK